MDLDLSTPAAAKTAPVRATDASARSALYDARIYGIVTEEEYRRELRYLNRKRAVAWLFAAPVLIGEAALFVTVIATFVIAAALIAG